MYREELEAAEGFGEIFRLVKRAVEERLGLHRAGLSLALVDLPPIILAQHQLGSNLIVMNRGVFEAVRWRAESRVELNSYIFVVLLHEYLHSLGLVDEATVRRRVWEVVRWAFGEGHPALLMASKPLNELYPEVFMVRPERERPIVIRDFDEESMPYIG
jgi:hypothetical protein